MGPVVPDGNGKHNQVQRRSGQQAILDEQGYWKPR
jgi:hypothetical protein